MAEMDGDGGMYPKHKSTNSWRPKGWDIADYPVEYCEHIIGITNAFESGADAMHKEDVSWLIKRVTHDDRGYVFKMSDKEWQEFIKEVRYE